MRGRRLAQAGRVTGIVGGSLMILGAAWKLLAYATSGQGSDGSGMFGALAVIADLLGLIAALVAVFPLLAGIVVVVLAVWYPIDEVPTGKAAAIGVLACGGLGLLVGAGFNTGALVIVGALAVLVGGILLLVDANGEDHGASGQAPPI